MDSAGDRFFAIPELLEMVVSFLDQKRDLSCLMRTRRLVHKACAPHLYRDIDMVDRHPGLRSSSESLQALVRNSHLVKSITMDGQFLGLYYIGVIKATRDYYGPAFCVEEKAAATTRTALIRSTSNSSTLSEIPSLSIPSTSTIPKTTKLTMQNTNILSRLVSLPFQPMDRLTSFVCQVPFMPQRAHTNTLPAHQNSDGILLRICRVLPSSPLLTMVHLSELHIKNKNQLRLLARTIAAMEHLEEVCLYTFASTSTFLETIIPTLFFSCPPTLKSAVFDLKAHGQAHLDITNKQDATIPPDSTLATMLQNPPLRRTSPLHHLTKLYLNCEAAGSTDTDTVRSILTHCPALVSLGLPSSMALKETAEQFADAIVKACPRLQDLHQEYATGNMEESIMAAIIDAMPAGTLRAFSFNKFNEGNDDFGSAFDRHSSSLAKINLPDCQGLSEETIQLILHNCSELVEFEAVGDENARTKSEIELELLAEAPWATKKLQVLRLTVGISEWVDKHFEAEDRDFDGYDDFDFIDPSATRVMEDCLDMKERIGEMYEEIGAQTDLRILDLRMSMSSSNDAWSSLYSNRPRPVYTYRNNIFPDMLSLGPKYRGGRRGWGGLKYFSKLSKLEELRGSVCVNSIETEYEYELGQDEAVWMSKFWPKLKVAEFYRQKKGEQPPEVAPHFKWLLERMPGLQIVVE